MIVVPKFRAVLSLPDLRLSLYTRPMRFASLMDPLGLDPVSQRHSVTKNTFPWSDFPGTVHLSPSLSVRRLAKFRMRQSRVSLVAIVKFRLTASGQDRVCPYPHVPRAPGCLGLIVHSLPGQPHLRGGVDGCCPYFFCLLTPLFGRIHHCTTPLLGALLIN
jgi:hypothetical protein